MAPAKRVRPTSASPAGGNGKHMVYLSGVTDHHIQDADMIDHIVRLVEAKAAEIEAANAENAPESPIAAE